MSIVLFHTETTTESTSLLRQPTNLTIEYFLLKNCTSVKQPPQPVKDITNSASLDTIRFIILDNFTEHVQPVTVTVTVSESLLILQGYKITRMCICQWQRSIDLGMCLSSSLWCFLPVLIEPGSVFLTGGVLLSL